MKIFHRSLVASAALTLAACATTAPPTPVALQAPAAWQAPLPHQGSLRPIRRCQQIRSGEDRDGHRACRYPRRRVGLGRFQLMKGPPEKHHGHDDEVQDNAQKKCRKAHERERVRRMA